ncbi:hypothetical protein CHL67_04250 [Prosthecochloris sp. GSB1]|uniref:DUF1615 family protein n=1 Tax=Prosthecochloris sp. GSB1 TaxID=281093 RepID=UPI000B8D182A|nr:DUF1615 family protein [Prosthecochloris sp. GSB1]ASQ90238.1 hypothetical protein CHL67_04250 [Prosthecochloris sp. GSB1]
MTSGANRAICIALLLALFLGGCSERREAGLSQRQIEKLVLAAKPCCESPGTWAAAIRESLLEIGKPVDKEHVCAVIAIIRQVSGFATVPQNSAMPAILKKKIESSESNEVLRFIIQKRLDQTASNGKTFRENIDSVGSERDFELWYNEFTSAVITRPILLAFNKDISNLVTTLGSMQVSVKFAEAYPKRPRNAGLAGIREVLYTTKGGVFYGTAYLLDYEHRYDDWKYIFADFNAGHYTSRNAGFQKMLASLSRKTIELDGDLLSYKNGGNGSPSVTYTTFLELLKKKGVAFDEKTIARDFAQEKSIDFEKTYSYRTLSAMHRETFGYTVHAVLPEISLNSPKFVSKNLSTKWFARRVKSIYNRCMRTRI